MTELRWVFPVDGENFDSAGNASEATKLRLKQLGLPNELIRRVAVAMYEGEINMVIHANGGEAVVVVGKEEISVKLTDTGKGIADIEKAMQAGFSTADERIRTLGFGAGMGLPNMKRYSDAMHIESYVGKGTTVTLKFRIES